MSESQQRNVFVPTGKERVGDDHEGRSPFLDGGSQGTFNFALGTSADENDVQPEAVRCRLRGLDFDVRNRHAARAQQQGDLGRGRKNLSHQLQPLWQELLAERCDPGDVSSGPVPTGDEPKLDRISSGCEDDWDSLGRRHCPARVAGSLSMEMMTATLRPARSAAISGSRSN